MPYFWGCKMEVFPPKQSQSLVLSYKMDLEFWVVWKGFSLPKDPKNLDPSYLFQNNPKNLDPSSKMDLDFWDCFGRENLSNSQIAHD